MYLKGASLLLPLICFVLTGQDTSRKRHAVERNNAGNFESAKRISAVNQKIGGSLEKAALQQDMNRGIYSRPIRSSNREIRSGSWEGSRGFWCVGDDYISTRWVCDGEIDCPDSADPNYHDESHCFDCGDGTAIESVWVCDGKADCTNGLDEDVCFECKDGYTIESSSVCDGDFNCWSDDSDERCLDCGGGNFIHLFKFCDRNIDCTNGLDEERCFECGNGNAIHFSRVCNGDTDCTNGLDENDCFQCGRGKVIHASQACDGKEDCNNGLDEKDCQFLTCHDNETEEGCLNATCPNEDHYFRCNSGHSTFQVYRCDGIPDCEDESDELDCYVTPCPEDHYVCPDGRCKTLMYFCEYVYNEYSDFRDRSDHYCPVLSGSDATYKCNNYSCFDVVNTFQCTSGECIKASLRCNLENDCPDSSDELACENHTCSDQGDFQCDSGQCIPTGLLCFEKRCPDNSDAMTCDVGCDTLSSKQTSQCANGQCIDLEDVCNHEPDCVDKSDESSCENHTCEFFHFRCNSGQCILSHKQCDNQADCFDISDEVNCQSRCPANHLRCDDDLCYPVYKRCDGNKDCVDDSDENNCANDTIICPLGHAPCDIKTSQCVPDVFICDGVIDCNDTTDEFNCDHITTCPEDDYYKCSTGRCLLLDYVCNDPMQVNYFICPDKPDNVTCNSYKCETNEWQFRCNTGHCISKFNLCNLKVDCPDGSDEDDCESECGSQSFNCSNGVCFARSTVCDGTIHCSDGGDERKCRFNCPTGEYSCKSGHCIEMAGLCNGYFEDEGNTLSLIHGERNWCPVFHDDEKYCPFMKCPLYYRRKPTGGCDEITDRTNRNCSTSETSSDCNNKCPNDLYYIKCCNCSCVHRVSICDGINDCPDGADERNCGRVECRTDQLYCGNITCFPIEFKCDGYPHCPHGHDEKSCTLTETTLTQHSMTMNKPQTVATQTDDQQACFDPSVCFTADQICKSTGRCNIERDNAYCFLLCSSPCVCKSAGQMICKQRVDYNNSSIKDDSKLLWPFNTSRRIDNLKANKGNSLFFTFETVSRVSITHASLQRVPTRLLSCAFNIQYLDLSHNAITHIAVGDFGRLYLLALLDLSHNPISSIEDFSFKGIRVHELRLEENKISEFGIDLFSGMAIDRTLKTDDYRFCCVRPPHLPEHNCYPRPDQFSSCKDLMKNTVLSTMVWIMGFLTLVGNITVILLMVTVEKESLTKNHGVMITNLAVADVLMGVYLVSIGSVDAMYRDIYITKDYEWRNSVWCSLVGVICMISSEASVFFICLITVDRYLIVKYPFGQVRLSRSNIIVISLCIWLISIAIAIIPVAVIPYFNGAFYSKSGVCIALPLTTESFDGWEYSFTISVCLNFVTFVIVGVGQYLIVRELVLAGRNSLVSTRRRNDFTIAIKLTFVVLSDVCCWVPIGVLGIMALTGFEIHPDSYAWVVVFVLPINSALNPFWYTLISQLTKYIKNMKNKTLVKTGSSRPR